MEERFIVTLDPGSGKIGLSVAKVTGDSLQVLYYRETPSEGIHYGKVRNPMKAAEAVRAAISEAEKELDIKIRQVVTALPRYEIRQESTPAEIVRTDPDSCISQEETDALKSMALDSYPLNDPNTERIYSAVAQSFETDDMMGAKEDEVVGTISEKIACNFKIFIGPRKPVNNIDTTMNQAGVAVAREYFMPEVTGLGVLSDNEMENGVGLIDFGAGVTSLSIYHGGMLRFYGSIPFGGESITSDIKYEGSLRNRLAENIKLAYGACCPDKLQNLSEKIIKICNDEDGTDQDLSVKYLSEIITCRVNEIFEAILYMLQASGYASKLRAGLVMTGGCANLVNCTGLLKEISGFNVRCGFPKTRKISVECSGLSNPEAAVTVGMLMKAREDKYLNCLEAGHAPVPGKESEEERIAGSALDRDAFEKVEVPEPGKPKPTPIWKRKLNRTFNDSFDGLFGKYYEDMK